MPRDAHMYSPTSQALLRAARMGQISRPPVPPTEDDKDLGDDEDIEGDLETGFVAKRWAVVPRQLEQPEPEFLAKRRKGLPSVYSGTVGSLGDSGHMRKTKVKKTDADGNTYVWEVLVPEGQMVEGEVIEQETAPTQALAPGTVVEGVGVANAEGVVIAGDHVLATPPRRRPPPPKRKPKGPGRGRKKKVGFVAIGGKGSLPSSGSSGAIAATTKGAEGIDGNLKHSNSDIEMKDDSALLEGDGSEEDEEGEDGDDGDREEGELSPSPSPSPSTQPSLSRSPTKQSAVPVAQKQSTTLLSPNLATKQASLSRGISSSPDLPLAAQQNIQTPIVKVVAPTDTLTTSATASPNIPAANSITVADPPDEDVTATSVSLPASHNPLDGFTTPEVHAEHAVERGTSEDALHFEDGEEDLLGSLERHLDRRQA